jgi:hypothetical protein
MEAEKNSKASCLVQCNVASHSHSQDVECLICFNLSVLLTRPDKQHFKCSGEVSRIVCPKKKTRPFEVER